MLAENSAQFCSFILSCSIKMLSNVLSFAYENMNLKHLLSQLINRNLAAEKEKIFQWQ
jgi:hypothetical protein